jgi:hypothetical protein
LSSAKRERHLKMAGKRAFPKAKSHRVFGQARKPGKMFRAGLYARVSTTDSTDHPVADPRSPGIRYPTWLDHRPAGEGDR